MQADIWSLYQLMYRSRLLEEAIADLWHAGRISGEMHLGTGEEAIIAGVVSQLKDGDALALDHRATAAFFMRGVDPVLLVREMLGRSDGLCGGMGGHMHLFSKDHLAASSGIVGAAGPAAVGFALAGQHLRPHSIAVAFFGEGSMNQGMLMESLNLASVWKLPVLFLCKDDDWAITTKPQQSTGGDLDIRARGLGVPVIPVDGTDVMSVWGASAAAIDRARSGQGPTFLHARCVHLEGHFLGFQLLRILRHPLKEMPVITGQLIRSLFQLDGARFSERVKSFGLVLNSVVVSSQDPRRIRDNDPLQYTRAILRSDPGRLEELERDARQEIDEIVTTSITEVAA